MCHVTQQYSSKSEPLYLSQTFIIRGRTLKSHKKARMKNSKENFLQFSREIGRKIQSRELSQHLEKNPETSAKRRL